VAKVRIHVIYPQPLKNELKLSMPRSDVVVIGGGHNGLVCAAYLAMAGLSVTVLEQKSVVGGCVVTEEALPGWKVNTYSFEHYVIQNTPIITELGLQNYGLAYYSVDPAAFCPFPDEEYLLLYRDLDKTLKHLEGLSKKDSRAYKKFHQKWAKVSQALAFGAFSGPAPFTKILADSKLFKNDAEVADIIEESKLPATKILSETFETDYMSVLVAFLGPAAIGLSPTAPNTGWLCAWHIGVEKLARPFGGSGMLTQALASAAVAHGATIVTGEQVTEMLVNYRHASGVKTLSGKTFEAKVVVSNADPRQTLKLADKAGALSVEERSLPEKIKVTGGFAFKADYLLESLPTYVCNSDDEEIPNDCHRAATFIAPSVKALSKAFDEFSAGKNPVTPGLMVALHSATDPSLVPPEKESLVLETRYTPYKLNGMSWTEQDKEDECGRLLALYSEYCPGVEDLVEHSKYNAPSDMERDVFIPKGNFIHADMSFDQMFEKRPVPGLLDGYAVRFLNGLYICGSGAFPGGAVSGIPGHNAAMQILREWKSYS
jgi:phytoene dehydrogenase-like protein